LKDTVNFLVESTSSVQSSSSFSLNDDSMPSLDQGEEAADLYSPSDPNIDTRHVTSGEHGRGSRESEPTMPAGQQAEGPVATVPTLAEAGKHGPYEEQL
jgi:hypothetical protein